MRQTRALSRQAQAVLIALLNAGRDWTHGYELGRQTGTKSGTLYPLLIRLEEQGFLSAQWQQPTASGRPPRHAYRLTAAGVELASSVLSKLGQRTPHGRTAT